MRGLGYRGEYFTTILGNVYSVGLCPAVAVNRQLPPARGRGAFFRGDLRYESERWKKSRLGLKVSSALRAEKVARYRFVTGRPK